MRRGRTRVPALEKALAVVCEEDDQRIVVATARLDGAHDSGHLLIGKGHYPRAYSASNKAGSVMSSICWYRGKCCSRLRFLLKLRVKIRFVEVSRYGAREDQSCGTSRTPNPLGPEATRERGGRDVSGTVLGPAGVVDIKALVEPQAGRMVNADTNAPVV